LCTQNPSKTNCATSVQPNAQTKTAAKAPAIDDDLVELLRRMFAFRQVASMIAARLSETDR